MRIFLHIGFSGSNYRGWQWQPNVVSIQGTLQEKLKIIFKEEVTVLGCGRTDAGVHASQYICHITLEDSLAIDLKFLLNNHLPSDIVVYDIIEMEEEQHARFDADARTYDYFIHGSKDPALTQFSSLYDLQDVDFNLMREAVTLLPLYNDFLSFCKQPNAHKHTRCTVTKAALYVDESNQRLRFNITATRFLRGMIRLIVFALLKVGQGEMKLEQFKNLLENPEDLPEKPPAFANGLYLSKVDYPFLNLDNKHEMFRLLKTGLE
jgi:tRNA pseudouridine38-40 synthase